MKPNKKISPHAILALKEALHLIYWRKEDLQDFIKLSIDNKTILATINWNTTKREAAKELIDRMTNRLDIYETDLVSLLLSVTDFNDFSNLDYWDEDGSKKKRAQSAVETLRKHTTGYIQLTKEEEESRKRRMATEMKIAESKSLQSEIAALKALFLQIASNTNFQKRGFDFERFLKDLFALYELDPKGSFKNYGEQIDGAFTHDNIDYLLEAKWATQVNQGDLAQFTFKVESKLKNCVGLLISIDGVTPQAISPNFKSIIIMDGSDIFAILDERISFPELLYKKRRKASETGNIYVPFKDL